MLHRGCSWALGAGAAGITLSVRAGHWHGAQRLGDSKHPYLCCADTEHHLICASVGFIFMASSFLFLLEMAASMHEHALLLNMFPWQSNLLLLGLIYMPKCLLESCIIPSFPSPPFLKKILFLCICTVRLGVFPQTEQISISALRTRVMLLSIVLQCPAQLQATEMKIAMGNDAWLH